MYPTDEKEALAALKGNDLEIAAAAEAILWRIWCSSSNSEIARIFRAGVGAMQSGLLDDAESFFGNIIDALPEFAEGWNKRATVRYMRKNFLGAIADCQETLARNPNHFGAAAGQGLCHLSLCQFPEAAICFRRALDIHPHLAGARQNLALAESEGGGTGYLH
jgi:tetratricopeptide (TPR) repeat protein